MTAGRPRTRDEILRASVDRAKLEARSEELASTGGLAPSTIESREWGWDYFKRCCAVQRPPLELPATPQNVVRFLTAHEHDAHATARGRVDAILWGHQQQYGTDPCHHPAVKAWLAWHAHEYGTMSTPVSAATREVLLLLVAASYEPAAGGEFVRARIRSIITTSYAATLRGGEACGIRYDAILIRDESVRGVTLARTKTSPNKPVRVRLETPREPELDPIVALNEYLAVGGDLGVDLRRGHLYRALVRTGAAWRPIVDTPLLLQQYRRDVQRLAVVVGLDDDGLRVATNSCRRGWATDAAFDGRTVHEIKKQGRWKRLANAQCYIDAANLLRPDLQVDY